MTEFKNYICIDGKKAELTEEQLKALGIELPKKETPFDRRKLHGQYYMISEAGEVWQTVELNDSDDRKRYKVANYCADHYLMEQRCMHETLHRLLWRFSIMNRNEDKADAGFYYYIYCSYGTKKWGIDCCSPDSYTPNDIWFDTEEIAERAIKEIAEPFMTEHPDFKLFY